MDELSEQEVASETASEDGYDASIDLTEGAGLVGTTALQTRLVEGLLMGLNQTKSARRAGYQGDGNQIRSAASKACRAPKVKALLAWAEGQNLGIPDHPGDFEELDRILWRHIRSSDKSNSIRAGKEWALIAQYRANMPNDQAEDPRTTLDEIAAIDLLYAHALARQEGIKDWRPKEHAELEADAAALPKCPTCGQFMRSPPEPAKPNGADSEPAAPSEQPHPFEAVS